MNLPKHQRYVKGRTKLKKYLESFPLDRMGEVLSGLSISGSRQILRSPDPDVDFFLSLASREENRHSDSDSVLLSRAIAAHNFAFLIRTTGEAAVYSSDSEVLNISNNLFLPNPEIWFTDPLYVAHRINYRRISDARRELRFPVNLMRIELYSTLQVCRWNPLRRAALVAHWWEELTIGERVFILDVDGLSHSEKRELLDLDIHMAHSDKRHGTLYRFSDEYPNFMEPFGTTNRYHTRSYRDVFMTARGLLCREIGIWELPILCGEWRDSALESTVRKWIQIDPLAKDVRYHLYGQESCNCETQAGASEYSERQERLQPVVPIRAREVANAEIIGDSDIFGPDHGSGHSSMVDAETFACFLSYHRRDKAAVRALASALHVRGISVWLDEERLRPGVPWQPLLEAGIRASRSVAVLVGADGVGPWQEQEMRAALELAATDGRPVIPVLLPAAPATPELPLFLSGRTWVDLRADATAGNPSALDRLVWGITGCSPIGGSAGSASEPDGDQGPVGRNDERSHISISDSASD